MNDINDRIHVFQFHFRMDRQKAEHRGPELRMFDFLPEPAEDNFAGKFSQGQLDSGVDSEGILFFLSSAKSLVVRFV